MFKKNKKIATKKQVRGRLGPPALQPNPYNAHSQHIRPLQVLHPLPIIPRIHYNHIEFRQVLVKFVQVETALTSDVCFDKGRYGKEAGSGVSLS